MQNNRFVATDILWLQVCCVPLPARLICRPVSGTHSRCGKVCRTSRIRYTLYIAGCAGPQGIRHQAVGRRRVPQPPRAQRHCIGQVHSSRPPRSVRHAHAHPPQPHRIKEGKKRNEHARSLPPQKDAQGMKQVFLRSRGSALHNLHEYSNRVFVFSSSSVMSSFTRTAAAEVVSTCTLLKAAAWPACTAEFQPPRGSTASSTAIAFTLAADVRTYRGACRCRSSCMSRRHVTWHCRCCAFCLFAAHRPKLSRQPFFSCGINPDQSPA